MVGFYYYVINDYHWLCARLHDYRCVAKIHCYAMFNIAIPYPAWVINYRFYLLIQIRRDPSLLLLLILPTQNNKSVKAPFTRDVRKNTVLGVGSRANTALGFASCCICHSTPPLVLYFPYITRNGALTYTCS